MHICILSIKGVFEDSKEWGGVNTHAKKLIQILIEKGYDVTLITSVGKKRSKGNLRVIPINLRYERKLENQWFQRVFHEFFALHRLKKVDCVFSEGGAVRGLMKPLNAKKIPIIAFVHLLSIHYFYNIWQDVDSFKAFKSYVLRSLPRYVYDMFVMDMAFFRKCQKVVTGSTTIAGQLKKYYRLPANKVNVINNWVDPDEFKFSEDARHIYREKYSIKADDVVFLLVGSLWKPKGFRVALESFKSICSKIPNSYLLIAGEGQDRSYLQENILSLKEIRFRVKLLGLYPHAELPSLFSAADVFIIPSIMNEVLPYTLLEAMSCEIPIIATDIAANREALGKSGCFVPRNDVNSLARMMESFAYDLTNKKAEATYNRRRIAERFSNDMASRKINELIDEIKKEKT